MTANAIQGDREHCLESGMDDYVSKPINVNILADVLKKWMPDIKEKCSETVELADNEGMLIKNCPIEMSRMTDLFEDDEEIITELLAIFCDSLAPLKIKLVEAANEKNTDNVKAIAHETKGMAHNIGAVILATLAEQLEQAAIQENGVEIEQLIAQIQIEFNRAEHFIKNRK
jgi:HPt (histidine-containing phosphotransfer) domain-containing protein